MRISDWSSDVCSSDLARSRLLLQVFQQLLTREFSCDAVYQVDKESPCILAAYHGVGALACEAIHRRIIVFSDVETCSCSLSLQRLLNGCERLTPSLRKGDIPDIHLSGHISGEKSDVR